MITTREFFEHDAEDIINNIESIYSVQREESNKYLFEPFPSKDELLDKYEAGLDSPSRIYLISTIYLTRNNLQ